MPWYPRDFTSPAIPQQQLPKAKNNRQPNSPFTSQLSRNQDEAEAQVFKEAQNFVPHNPYGLSKEKMPETTMRRYQGALEEWKNVLQYSGQAAPSANHPELEQQISAVQERLSMLKSLMGRDQKPS